MSRQLRQVELFDAETHATLHCWLDVDPRIKQRAIVTLKGVPNRRWIVMRVYQTVRDESDVYRGWKVGGLNVKHT